jgi:hypothetical protein
MTGVRHPPRPEARAPRADRDDPLAVLRRVRAPAPRSGAARGGDPRPGERCELCAAPIGDAHRHVVDVERRALLCTCRPCFLLFTPTGAGGGHFRAVPDRYVVVDDVAVAPAVWDALEIPVSVAFFLVNSQLARVAAFYPGPAGATESELPLDVWGQVVAANPSLATVVPDVEAVLVRTRPGATTIECSIVPVDACYELVGTLRTCWRGFDGGREARAALDAFFARVRERAGAR